MKKYILLAATCLVAATTFAQFTVMLDNSIDNGTTFTCDIMISATADTYIADSDFYFNYNAAKLSAPTKMSGFASLGSNTANNFIIGIQGIGADASRLVSTTPRLLTKVSLTKSSMAVVIGSTDVTCSTQSASKVNRTTENFDAATINCLVNTVLAVELLDFKGKNTEGGNLLTWHTESEINNNHFVVEKSIDGRMFTGIGTVKGKGTTAATQSYTFTDATPYSTSYYRLNQVDNDGKTTLSKTIAIRQSIGKNNLKVYPNPTTTVLTIEHTPSVETLEIVNPMGQVVKTIQVNAESLQTDITTTELTNGIYFLRVNRSEMIRFVKI